MSKPQRGRPEERVKLTVDQAVAGLDRLIGKHPATEPPPKPELPHVRSKRPPKK